MMGNYHVRFGGRERRVLIEARPSRPNAEMGSAFLCASLGIVPTVRHADYIGAWRELVRDDPRAIFKAASQASKAADWLLARHAAAQGNAGTAGCGEGRGGDSDGGDSDGADSDGAGTGAQIGGGRVLA